MRNLFIRLALGSLFLFALIPFAQQTRDATLSVRIVDGASGSPTPVRVRLQDAHGNRPQAHAALAISETAIPVPREAIAVMWGRQDRAEGYAIQPDGSFYVDGSFKVRVPPGEYSLTISKGFEYSRQPDRIDLRPGASVTREYRLARWVDMPASGWYSADDHIHLHRSPADNPNILRWIAAEDIHVGNILEMGDFWATFFAQYAFGEAGRYQESGVPARLLSPGQEEPRTPEVGHTISLGANELVRFQRDYYSYDRLFDRVHQLGGVTGFAHQGFSFHGYRGMTLNVIRGKNDFLELAQFCVPEGPLATTHYYHFLDMGFKLTALAGSDFPWCGQGPEYGFREPRFAQIGNARFYTYVGSGQPTFERWMAALKAGHTFVSTGPMILLTVNGRIPGDSLDVQPGATLHITAEAFGEAKQAPLHKLEVIGHSKVLQADAGQDPAHRRLEFDLPAKHGIWIAARCDAGTGQVAHTTPVYVTVNGDGFHDPANAQRNLEISEGYLKELEQELADPGKTLDSQTSRHKAQLERQIAEARTRLGALAARLK
jgi:hypothetical protein